jgi:hypothetical protein
MDTHSYILHIVTDIGTFFTVLDCKVVKSVIKWDEVVILTERSF